MLTIGCHLSSAKGYEAMAKEAEKIQANTFQFFTRNPRGGNAKEIKEEDVRAYGERARKQGITRILARALYLKRLFGKGERPGFCLQSHEGRYGTHGIYSQELL